MTTACISCHNPSRHASLSSSQPYQQVAIFKPHLYKHIASHDATQQSALGTIIKHPQAVLARSRLEQVPVWHKLYEGAT